MKESIKGIDRNLIFRETFNSEQTVRRNGGQPTDIDFSNGIGTLNGASRKIIYPIKYGVKTIRFKINLATTTENILKLSSTHNISVSSGTISATGFASPTIYVEGSLTSNITTGWKEVMITTSTAFNADDIILGFISSYGEFDIDLIEIYNKALTAEEVSNLYNNLTYRDVRDGLALDIDSRQGVIEDRRGNALTISGVEVKKDNVNCSYFTIGYGAYLRIQKNITVSTGITITGWFKFTSLFSSTSDRNLMHLDSASNLYILGINRWGAIGATISNSGDLVGIPTSHVNLKWYMISVTFAATGLIIYENGIKVGENTNPQTLTDITDIYIGKPATTEAPYEGYQNQQRVMNRVYTAQEISQLYTSQRNNYE